MFDLGINAESFNPQVLYAIKVANKDTIKTRYHCHSHIELSYVISGTVTYNVNNTIYKLKKGDFLLFNSGVYHEEILSPGEEVVELHLGFDNINIKGLSENCLMEDNISSFVSLKRNHREFTSCINQIVSEHEKSRPGFEIILKSLVMKLIVILLRETYLVEDGKKSDSCSINSSEKSIIVQTIISYMNEKYDEDISLDKMSKTNYLSPAYISKIFKEETGFSPINYLINVRLEKAKQLLAEGALPIKSVAKSVGYDDAYYFSKLFKKYYGYPPSMFLPK